MKTKSKYILLLFVSIIVLLLGGIFLAAQQEKEGPITAEAASVYWSTPTACPGCGTIPDNTASALRIEHVSGCTYSYRHMGHSSTPFCQGTITIHNSETGSQAPTCINGGWEYFQRCRDCGEYATRQGYINPLGHDYAVWVTTIPATCTTDGKEEAKCSRGCASTMTRKIAATGHTWDNGTVTLSATCQRTGTRKYECTACGETKTETIAKRSHNYNIYLSRVEPTCTASGRTAGYECQWC